MQSARNARLIGDIEQFDVTGHAPKLEEGRVTLDGGDLVWRAFGQGVGVTGYDEVDCRQLITDMCDLPLPPVTARVADVTKWRRSSSGR